MKKMKIDHKKVKDDLTGDLYMEYMNYYPSFEEKILKLRRTPDCTSCFDNTVVPILTQEASKWKFSQIYKVEQSSITVDTTLPDVERKIEWINKTEIHKVERGKYEEWVKDFYENKKVPQVKMYNTFYEPVSDRIVITLVLLVSIEA
jgi:hypothetical protein